MAPRSYPFSVPWTKWIMMAQPFNVQALLISVCHGERTPETVGWPKAHLDTTSNHAPWNSEPKSCAWRVPKHKAQKTKHKTQSTKRKAQNTKHKTQSTTHSMANKTARSLIWSNFVRKSREAGLMWLLGPIHFLFLEQNGSWWHNPSMSRPYLSQYAMVKGHLRPWDDPKHTWTPPRTMLLGTSEPKSCAWRVPKHKAQNTKHNPQHGRQNCKKLNLE